MSYLFRLRTDTGITQVDETFANLALIQSGQIQLDQVGPFTNIKFGTLQFSGRESPVLALRAPYPVGYKAINVSGSTWQYQLATELKWQTSAPVNWYLFDRPPPQGSGWQVCLRDAQGREVFNANNRYMRPKAFHVLAANVPGSHDELVDFVGLPTGTYAAIPSTNRNAGWSYTVFDTSNALQQQVDGVQALPNGVRVGWVAINDQSWPGDPGFFQSTRPGFVTVIDVAGY